MKNVGCVLALVGLAVSIGGAVLLIFILVNRLTQEPLSSLSLESGQEATGELVAPTEGQRYRLAFRARVSSTSVQEETDAAGSFEDPGYELRYSFPLSYRVSDDSGDPVLSNDMVVHWNEGARCLSGEVEADGGTQTVTHYLPMFTVPRGGEMQVAAQVNPDPTYGARAEDISLLIYEVPAIRALLWPAVLMTLSGPMLALVGLVLLLCGALVRGAKPGEHGTDGQGGDEPRC